MKKSEVPLKKEKITDEVLERELTSLEATNVKEEAEKELDKGQLKIIKRVAYYIGKVGLEISDICILLGIDYNNFLEEMETFPVMRRIVDMKEVEYKKDLLATLSAKARNGDDKIALQLLESKDPDKYGKKKGITDPGNDMITTAIEFIQTRDSTGLVKETSRRAIVIQTDKKKPQMSTHEILSQINQIASPKK